MSQNNRIDIGILTIVLLVGVVLGTDQIQRKQQTAVVPDIPPKAIPIH